MNVLIVEDEKHTAKGLARMLKEIDERIEVAEYIDSVEEAVNYLSAQPLIDLIFLDIQLSDGLSFEIFNNIEVSTPIIFTTSFNEYAIKAFEVNSVDYLLKPIQISQLEKSISKFKKIFSERRSSNANIEAFLNQFRTENKEYKKRFLVKNKNAQISVQTGDIAYFYIENQLTYLHTKDNKRYCVNYTMESIEKMLSPKEFFRINRQFIIHIDSVMKINGYFNSTLKLSVTPPLEADVIVSRYAAKEFREWMGE